ncbi:MAG TPA: OmpA family protein [Streptosporangiaceae bacterium]|jgi:outer membrane protein OmpA-like peptidoglycan-associated protein
MRGVLIGAGASVALFALAGPAAAQTTPAIKQAPAHHGPVKTAPVISFSGKASAITGQVLSFGGGISNMDESVTDDNNGGKRTITLAADVVFAFNKATLNGKAKSRIADVVAKLRTAAKNKAVAVDGYTDAKGSPSYNQSLSVRRAQAVQKALRAQLSGTGITFTAKGHGEGDPVASNTKKDKHGNTVDNPSGRAKNRRVTISFRA